MNGAGDDRYTYLRLYIDTLRNIEDTIGSGETSNYQLNRLGKKLIGSKFLGCYAIDDQPMNNIQNGESYIVNSDKSTGVGKHWMSIIKDNNKMYIYDSYNRPPTKINKLFKGYGRLGDHKPDQSQSYINNESNCGQRSLSSIVLYNKCGINALKYI